MKKISVIFVFLFMFAMSGYAQSARDEAISLYKKGDIDRAIVLLKEASAGNEQDAELQSYLGLAYLKKNETGEALSYLEKAAAKNNADGSTKARILRKPIPQFSLEARDNKVNGIIKMYVVFGADGNIAGAVPLNRLGAGLDERAAEAAKQIKFVPGSRDGKKTASVSLLEYSFKTYN